MPLPHYAFEWGPDKGAVELNDKNIIAMAEGLANISKQRSAWFRTKNVLIPWGTILVLQLNFSLCHFMFAMNRMRLPISKCVFSL